jgi:hypothetical protein
MPVKRNKIVSKEIFRVIPEFSVARIIAGFSAQLFHGGDNRQLAG